MSASPSPQRLDYDPRVFSRWHRFLAWAYRRRLRFAMLLSISISVLVILYRGVFYETQTLHDPRTYTAVRQSHIGVGGVIVWHHSEPATFLYADVAQPDDPPITCLQDDSFTHNRLAWRRAPQQPWVFQLTGKRHADGMWIVCASGLRQRVDAKQQAFEAARKSLPNASQKQRYAMFRHIVESLRPYDGTTEYSAMNDWPALIGDAIKVSSQIPAAGASPDPDAH